MARGKRKTLSRVTSGTDGELQGDLGLARPRKKRSRMTRAAAAVLGGKARVAKMTQAELSASAATAARARWEKVPAAARSAHARKASLAAARKRRKLAQSRRWKRDRAAEARQIPMFDHLGPITSD